VEVTVGVRVADEVTVGPNNPYGPQAAKSILMPMVQMMIVRFFVFIGLLCVAFRVA
jgi:hypothetical protein